MSNSPPSDLKKAPGDAPCECLTSLTSEPPCEHGISPQEQKQQRNNAKKGHTEACDGGRPGQALVGDGNCPQNGDAKSPGYAQDEPNEAAKGGRERGGGGGGGGDGNAHDRGGNEDDNDGYHTPTSPRHRIPTDLPCPPAPRKSPVRRRWWKRKSGDQEFRQVLRRRLQLPDEIELVFFPVVDGAPAATTRIKKSGGDDLLDTQ